MIDENTIGGTARGLGGRVQDAFGGLTGDTATQAKGKANQAAGQAQNLYGQVLEYASDQPLAALLAAMGVGLGIGFLLARR